MAWHYSTKDFFRQIPNLFPARYFQERGLFAELDFAAMKGIIKPDLLSAAWLGLPGGQSNRIDAELMEIFDLSSDKGFCAVRNEAESRVRADAEALRAFIEKLAALDSHRERAMATFLQQLDFWRGATYFLHADTLSHWRKRKGFPRSPRRSIRTDGTCLLG